MKINPRLRQTFRYIALTCIILIPIILSGQVLNQSPVIKITNPLPADRSTNSVTTLVRAEITSISQIRSFSIFNNKRVVSSETMTQTKKKDSITYIVESLVTLQIGSNIIYVEATNKAGKSSSEDCVVHFQSEPFINWLTPISENSSIKTENAFIKAEIKTDYDLKNVFIDNNGTTIKCEDGIARLNNNTYLLEKTIKLNRDNNNILIIADNIKGSAKSSPRVIRVLGMVPEIIIVTPSLIDTINNSGILLVKSEIISESPLLTFRIFNNNNVVSDESMTKPKQKDSLTYIVESLVALQFGTNIIYVEANNNIGKSSSKNSIINFRPTPFINWLTPGAENSTIKTENTFVKAEIKTDFDLKNVFIDLNGKTIPCEDAITRINNNTYILEKTITLPGDKNNISIIADNSKGSTKSSTRVIKISGLKPDITIVAPSLIDSINNSGISLVKSEIISKSPLLTFKIFNNNKVVSDESMSKPKQKDSITYIVESLVALEFGTNIVYVEAVNIIGKSSSEISTINFRPAPFINWLTPVSENSTIETGNFMIKAEIKTDLELKNASINLNGTTIPCDDAIIQINNNTYSLEKTIVLDRDKNSVAIMASNSKGVTRSLPRIVRITGQVPHIKIITPLITDSVNNTGVILVSAEIESKTQIQSFRIINNEDIAANEIMSKPKKKDSVTYIVESLIALKNGINSISIEAKNSNGSSETGKRVVTCKLEPIIKWILPAALNSVTGSERLNIKAELLSSLDLQNTVINLNETVLNIDKGEITRLSNNVYSFEKKVTLKPGENSITITASNARGAAFSAKYNVTYKPEIISEVTWIAPSSSTQETNSAELPLSANIKTSSKIKNTALFVNEKETIPGSRYKLSSGKATEYSYENSVVLKPGINTIYISAITDEGTISSEKRTVNYIVPSLPAIIWKTPSSDNLAVSNPSVDIRIEIKSNTKIEGLTLYLNGKISGNEDLIKALRKEEDAYILEKNVLLNTGTNSINFVAKNLAGTITSETRSVSYTFSTIPIVTWVSPSNPSTDINISSARIRLKIQSSDKLQSLLAYVNGSASEELSQLISGSIAGEYTLEKPVNLQPGRNEIYVIATNSSGTTKSDIRYLTNPPTNPPLISWVNPTDSKVIVNSESVVIEACIKSATVLKSVQILVNGVQQASEMLFQQPGTGECNYRFTKLIFLRDGDNSVYIIAENFAGSTPSEKRSLRFEVTSMVEKRLALVFGNAEYGSSNSLKNPVNDANLMEGTLKNLGFEVIKKINASKSEMEGALREFSNKLPQYNVALFYYAGHGVQVEGENYLVPVDAKLENKTDCQWEALPVDKIIRQFEQVPENINIVILDACRDNPFRSWSRGGAQGFRALSPVSGTIVSFATSENSVAADGSGSNGTFTEELVKQMNIPQPVEVVFKNTRREVMKRTNNGQRPQEWNMLTGDFYFKK